MKKTLALFIFSFLLFGCSDNIAQTTKDVENLKEENIEKNILALGDSLTAGYNLDISNSYPSQLKSLLQKDGYNYKVINAGVSGDTSKNLLSRIHLYEQDYKIILLNIGGNDALRSLSTDDLKDNIISIIDTFPESKIVLFSIDIPGNYGLAYRKSLKEVYKNIAKEKDLYFYGLFFEGLDYDKHFLSDKIHPNALGYEIIAENIYTYLIENKLIQND